MKVFKFGGASLKNPKGVRNVASIIQSSKDNNLLVVVSAMGKTTDMLEKILTLARTGQNATPEITALRDYHQGIIKELFAPGHPVWKSVDEIFDTLLSNLKLQGEADMVYDQVVSTGEILSSIIVHHYLHQQNLNSHWLDARTCVATDSCFREGKVS
jgi:aspartate kinase